MRDQPAAIAVLLADPRLPDVTKPGGRFTADDFDQVVRLKAALAELRAYRFDYLDDHNRVLEALRTHPPELVLNFCDTGFCNDARRELELAAYLDLLGIPYTGAGPAAMVLCYDKALVRVLAAELGVPVPQEAFVGAEESDLNGFDSWPALVKPNTGDGSVGITAGSVVAGREEAFACIDRLRQEWPGRDLLVQEFLPGTEYGLGLIGNPADGFRALPMLEVDYSGLDAELPRILSYESKTLPDSPYWTQIRYQPAALDRAVVARLTGYAERLFGRLQLRDYARFDFRADTRGEIKLMEVNPNPAWCWDGKLNLMAGFAGMKHSDLLESIIMSATTRVRATEPLATRAR